MPDFFSNLSYYGTKKASFVVILFFGCVFIYAYQFSGNNTSDRAFASNVIAQSPSSEETSVLNTSLIAHNNNVIDAGTALNYIFQTKSPLTVAQTSKNVIKKSNFDINGTDVIVFLHIQKTGGTTFGRHLVNDLELQKNCIKKGPKRKSYFCHRPGDNTDWLFSRYSTGWTCGVHADWTSLTECVPTKFDPIPIGERKFFYITIIREPVARYLSEWKHVARGATWAANYLTCSGDHYEYPRCWTGEDWSGVTLDEFLNCSDNLAINRQTRMLANLREINCTGKLMDPAERDKVMLESAKRNLQEMLFFGVTERQRDTQTLFEAVFDFHFKVDFFNYNITKASTYTPTYDQFKRVRELNNLDIELYQFATKLFDERFKATKKS